MDNLYKLEDGKISKTTDVYEWAESINKTRNLKQSYVENKLISTVFLGMEYGYLYDKPILFETMVFDIDGEDIDMDRYTTLEDAIKGHEKMVEKYSPNHIKLEDDLFEI